jgi:hypothetical protein
MSFLGAFNTQLIRFFEQLAETFPEERDIKMAVEAIHGLKKINPKMILQLFHDNVYKPVGEPIKREDEEVVIAYAKQIITSQYNEMSIALVMFDKYWPSLTDANKEVIWKYLKVLCVLCEKALNL